MYGLSDPSALFGSRLTDGTISDPSPAPFPVLNPAYPPRCMGARWRFPVLTCPQRPPSVPWLWHKRVEDDETGGAIQRVRKAQKTIISLHEQRVRTTMG